MNPRRARTVVLLAVISLTVANGCAAPGVPQMAARPPLPAYAAQAAPSAAVGNTPSGQPSTPPQPAARDAADLQPPVFRGQDAAARGADPIFRGGVQLAQYQTPPAGSNFPVGPPPSPASPPAASAAPPVGAPPGASNAGGGLAPNGYDAGGHWLTTPPGIAPLVPGTGVFGGPTPPPDPVLSTPVDVFVEETQTGRFMFGAGINSDAGVTGQIVIDERNFDITRLPTSWRDFADGTAFRGAGQGLRIEAMPGTQVQRYLVSFTEPYLFDTPVSFNVSGFLYDRRFFDWSEQRLGGRMALGYRLTPDMSVAASLRAENVEITNPRVMIPQLTNVLGDNGLYSGRLTLTSDTRDIPFAPTAGHLIELGVEQAFGTFDFPRADLDLRKYFLVRERPDGSGRHTLGFLFRLGFSGSHTPIFENYFAGGYSTLRGFDFRGASPMVNTVRVGGTFMFLGAAEYVFPLTADDMLKGALFCDFGTVEPDVRLRADTYRVAPGFGLRVNVPALGPAPLAFDFAFPVAKADTDDTRVFTFFLGVGR